MTTSTISEFENDFDKTSYNIRRACLVNRPPVLAKNNRSGL